MKRVLAWACVLGVGWWAYGAVSALKNPWSIEALPKVESPVLKALPAMPDGCAKSQECLK